LAKADVIILGLHAKDCCCQVMAVVACVVPPAAGVCAVAEKSWKKLTAPDLLPLVASGVTFKDGVMTKSGGVESEGNHQPKRTAA
jgi:hypothetical protein